MGRCIIYWLMYLFDSTFENRSNVEFLIREQLPMLLLKRIIFGISDDSLTGFLGMKPLNRIGKINILSKMKKILWFTNLTSFNKTCNLKELWTRFFHVEQVASFIPDIHWVHITISVNAGNYKDNFGQVKKMKFCHISLIFMRN